MVEAIEAFYSRHDISREAPGMKDTVIVRTADIKEIKRKLYLMYKLREVYAMFCEEHGTIVGFSTFCNLRPVNVLVSRSTPHDMCHETHENFISLANALFHHTISSGLMRMQCVSLMKGACSVIVQFAKMAKNLRKLFKESKSLTTKLKCFDGRR